MLLLVSVSLAAEPVAYQCQAVWVGPREECSLEGNWTGTGAGRSEKSARKDAQNALVESVTLGARGAADRTKGTMAAATTAPQLDSCPRSAEETATTTCIQADGLAAYQVCFVDLVEPVCEHATDQLTIEAHGYDAFALGRKQMCDKIEKELREKGVATIDACLASCDQHVRVRCPGIPAKEP
jgi:hypothetical protein